MKNLKKNNKGFSLVELIVVVLIIAIIAVALAPQVIKWVDQARKNTKENNSATIKSAIQTCVAEVQSKTSINATKITVKGTTVTLDTDTTVSEGVTFKSLIQAAIEGIKDDANTYYYNVSGTGAVTESTTGASGT
ncbi:MAG: prepilin-type N-terminal cleavage/methylation domain-containing protein [Lachnospiraceae bacterium]|nr:prepilin-type N-terminal cleavage/methylation domain-containing protein [Lachnospiraceae bacterium]